MMKFRTLLFSALVMAFLCAGHFALAADVTLIPGIGLTGLYDDNVEFQYGQDKNDDFVYVVEPVITYDYATEINRLTAEAILSARSFIEYDEYNAIDQTYKLKGNSRITELLTLAADLKYIKDDTLQSELDETGRVTERDDRQRYDLKGRFFLNMTELIRVGGEYQYRQTDYGAESSEDYNDDTVSFIYNQRLKNQLDALSFLTSYAYREVRTHETNTYRTVVGWKRDLSETFSIQTILGGRFTEQYNFDGNSRRIKNESSGFLADLRFYKLTGNSRMELRYRRDQVYEANGGAREVDNISVGMDRNLTERLAFGVDFRCYWSRDVDDSANDNSQLYEAVPNIVYNLTENHRLGLYYSYQYEYDETEKVKDKNRNQVWLNLAFYFPKKM